MTVFFQRLSINDLPHHCFLLSQIYYFVETLSVSTTVSSYTAPPKLADAAHSRKLLQTHRAIYRSLIVVNPNIDPFSGSGAVFSILLHDLIRAVSFYCFCSSQVFIYL